MFRFYDTNGDGMIDFEEFVIGVALTNNKSKTPEKLKRIFVGYDLDEDGYVERKDFLRMFKSFYSLSKMLVKDIVASRSDELYEQGHMEQALNGRQPISAVFTSSIPQAGRTWDKPDSAAEDSDSGEDSAKPVVLPSSKDHMEAEELQPVPEGPTNSATERIEAKRIADFWAPMDDDEYDEMLPDDERDVGSEVLFHLAIRGINELLDLLFKEKELAAVALRMEDEAPVEGKEEQEEKQPEDEDNQPAAESSEAGAKDKDKDKEASPEEEEEDKRDKPEAKARQECAKHAAMREEIKERGGEGRLSFDEFKAIMTGSNFAKLEFVGTWIDLAGF